jgi:hypothetical protein
MKRTLLLAAIALELVFYAFVFLAFWFRNKAEQINGQFLRLSPMGWTIAMVVAGIMAVISLPVLVKFSDRYQQSQEKS